MRALALFSGGLDSMLAIKLMSKQGIKVTAVHMDIGFTSKDDISEVLAKRAKLAGGDFEMVDVRQEYIDKVLFTPKFGYGKHFNPCIDCHGYMFFVAKELLSQFDASFMVTGEVLGQRPMSQHSRAMRSVKQLAGDEEDLILRPLSAKLMEPTKPEREGWVDRAKLLSISGRSREQQLKLAKEFGWEDFQSPGGGCLLTDAKFAKKMREFIMHESLHVDDIDVLKNGRHLRLPDGAKLVIGRDAKENERLAKANKKRYTLVDVDTIPSPLSLLSRDASLEDKLLCAKIVLTFCKTSSDKKYLVHVGDEKIKALPFANREQTHKFFVL